MLPQQPPPPPWAGAAPPQGPPIADGAMGRGIGAAQHVHRVASGSTTSAAWSRWRASPWRCRPSTSSSASSSNGSTRTSCAPPATSSASTSTTRRTASRRRRTTPPRNSFAGVGLLVGCSRWPRSSSPASGSTRRRRPVARSASRRGTRRPGASGCWFVPIVNLWMPYGAVRDCLPAEHPQRPRVLHWWIAWLLAGFLSTGGRHRRLVLDREPPSSCPSPPRWRAWP